LTTSSRPNVTLPSHPRFGGTDVGRGLEFFPQVLGGGCATLLSPM
jgi:hypothetical protein